MYKTGGKPRNLHDNSGLLITLSCSLLLSIFTLRILRFPARWFVSFAAIFFIVSILAMLKEPRRFLIALFFLSLPIETYNFPGVLVSSHLGGPPGLYHTFYDVLLFFLYTFWIFQLYTKRIKSPGLKKIDIIFIALICVCAISTLRAPDIKLSLYEVSRLLIMFLLFYYMSNALKDRKSIETAVICLFIGLIIESVLGCAQFIKQETLGLGLLGEPEILRRISPNSNIFRISGTLNDPNSFSVYLGMLIPLCLSLCFAPIKRVFKLCSGILGMGALFALILTFSRAGWIILLCSILLLISLQFKQRLRLRYLLAAGLLFLLLLFIPAFAFRGLISTRILSDDYRAAYSRVPLAKIAINIIKTHPVIGVGINNYSEVMFQYDDTPERISVTFGSVVHNSYLLIASEIGLIGLGLFLYFIYLTYKQAISFILINKYSLPSAVVIGLICGISAFLLHIFVEPAYLVHHTFFIFWTFSGLLFGITSKKIGLKNISFIQKP